MSYDQEQKNQQVLFFGADRGGGVFGNKTYDFVLREPYRLENLYPPLAEEMLQYFAAENIKWWRGQDDLPTNLTIASQISCLNHLYWLNSYPAAAESLLRQINTQWRAVPFASGRFVEFEYNGNPPEIAGGYLGETMAQRGMGGLCLNAAMLAQSASGARTLVAIEWRYCEKYYQKAAAMDDDDPLYVSRKNKLRGFLQDAECPIVLNYGQKPGQGDYETAFQKFSVEPFYTTMMQTLLAWQIVRHQREGATDFAYLQVIPDGNVLLLHGETSKAISGGCDDIACGWQRYLQAPQQFYRCDPRALVEGVARVYAPELAEYLHNRYWQHGPEK